MSLNYLLQIEYDGTGYCGWQKQPGLDTLDRRVEDALKPLFGGAIKLVVSGRTDAGVHALKQFCSFKSDVKLPVSKVRDLLNGRLPKDIAVMNVRMVDVSFDARYSAKSKTYEYRIWNGHGRSVWNRYYWQIVKPLDLAAMREASKILVGKHNFSAFEAPRSGMVSKIVHLKELRLIKCSSLVKLEFTANRFLYKMVRNLTGTLVEVGLGRLTLDEVKSILKSRKRSEAGPTAPPQGLFLKDVMYEKFESIIQDKELRSCAKRHDC